MNLFLTIVLLVLGILFVVKGGDLFVDAASWIAEVSGIPKLIIGATIVSVATTLPEMLVSVIAATQGKVDMSIGNAVGSVTANLGLIMAIAVICMPGKAKRKDYMLKSVLMLIACAMVVACGILGKVTLIASIILLIIFVVFIADNVMQAKNTISDKSNSCENDENKPLIDKKTIISNIAKFVVGAVGIVWGADLLVDNGSELARLIGVSERIIGVTLVAVGTSLPELITTITAIAKKQSALSVGNIIGANIMDLTLIMPLSSLISGKALPVSATSAMLDLPACLLVGLVAIIPTIVKSKFSRWQGFTLLGIYAVYLILTCTI